MGQIPLSPSQEAWGCILSGVMEAFAERRGAEPSEHARETAEIVWATLRDKFRFPGLDPVDQPVAAAGDGHSGAADSDVVVPLRTARRTGSDICGGGAS